MHFNVDHATCSCEHAIVPQQRTACNMQLYAMQQATVRDATCNCTRCNMQRWHATCNVTHTMQCTLHRAEDCDLQIAEAIRLSLSEQTASEQTDTAAPLTHGNDVTTNLSLSAALQVRPAQPRRGGRLHLVSACALPAGVSLCLCGFAAGEHAAVFWCGASRVARCRPVAGASQQ